MPIARFSFAIFGQDTNSLSKGQYIEIKDTNGALQASTNPPDPPTTVLKIEDNNDGTYYVDGLASGVYDIWYGRVQSSLYLHDEFKQLPFYNEDVKTHIDDTAQHRLIDDNAVGTTDLWSASKINTDLGNKANVSHTHTEAEVTDLDKYSQSQTDTLLSGKSDVGHSHTESDITDLDKYSQTTVDSMLSTKIVESVDSVNFEVVNNELALRDQDSGFTEQNYVDDTKSIFKNVDRLDQKLKDFTDNLTGTVERRIIYTDSVVENGDGVDAAALPVMSETGSSYKVKRRFLYRYRNGDSTMLMTIQGKADGINGGSCRLGIPSESLFSNLSFDQETSYVQKEASFSLNIPGFSLIDGVLYEVIFNMRMTAGTYFNTRYLFVEVY